MDLQESVLFMPAFCLFPPPKHSRKTKIQKRRPNPLPIFFLVVPPEMRPDPEKAIGGGGLSGACLPASRLCPQGREREKGGRQLLCKDSDGPVSTKCYFKASVHHYHFPL